MQGYILFQILVGTVLCPVLWNLMTQDRTLDMNRTCPKISPNSGTLSEKTSSILLFNACAWFVKVLTFENALKSKNFEVFLDKGWCMGGYMHKCSIKPVFKCPERTCCLHDVRTFFHAQDMSRTFPTKFQIGLQRCGHCILHNAPNINMFRNTRLQGNISIPLKATLSMSKGSKVFGFNLSLIALATWRTLWPIWLS